MSASLVGSEMCIRDRAPSLRAFARPQARSRAAPGPERNGPGPARLVARRPVSYTHLTLPTICSV
eukprot:14772941-Alexandrium_andersonii.AAC.1